jgi:hypothetical protein
MSADATTPDATSEDARVVEHEPFRVRLRRLREAKNYTPSRLAVLVGVTEGGDPSGGDPSDGIGTNQEG